MLSGSRKRGLWVGLAAAVVIFVGYNLIHPLNTEALRVLRNVSPDEVSFLVYSGARDSYYTYDRKRIEEVLDGLKWARYRSWMDGMASNKTAQVYFVLRDRKTMYRLDFNATDPSEDVSPAFKDALKNLESTPCLADPCAELYQLINSLSSS